MIQLSTNQIVSSFYTEVRLQSFPPKSEYNSMASVANIRYNLVYIMFIIINVSIIMSEFIYYKPTHKGEKV